MKERKPINLVDLDFDSIKSNLKAFLKSQTEFQDYNFEGSSLNIILDLLAYNSQNNAWLANTLANEMFIDSALLRKNIVSLVKLIGYVPKSVSAASAQIAVEITDPLNSAKSLLMPRGTKFRASSGGVSYTFVTLEDYNIPYDSTSGTFKNEEIIVHEGQIKFYSWLYQEGERFLLPTESADTNTFKIVVFDNVSSSDFTVFEKSDSFSDIDGTSKAFWINEFDEGIFEVRFGDGVFGKKLQSGNQIYIEYLETHGPDANSVGALGLVGTFSGYSSSSTTVSTIVNANGGSEKETTSSIKFNAQKRFSAQNRAVTKDDYISLIYQEFPAAKSVNVWGGEDMMPPKFGRVYASIVPYSLSKLSSSVKSSIQQKLKSKGVLGISPVIVDPEYIYMNIRNVVKISRAFMDNMPRISENIRTLAISYLKDSLERFGTDFFYSKYVSFISNSTDEIFSCVADITISKRYVSFPETVEFVNSIESGTLTSSKFENSDGIFKLIDQIGEVFLVSTSGATTKIGKIDYSNGTITFDVGAFSNFTNSFFEIFAKPKELDVFSEFNNALIADESRFSIELVAA